MSIFEQQSVALNKDFNFWTFKTQQSSSCLSLPVLFSSPAKFVVNNNTVENQVIFLNSKYIYFTFNNLIAEAKICWSIIESFVEGENENSIFGFSIKNHKGQQDFFIDLEDDLEKWLQKFSSVGILSGFDQDYVVIKNIDKSRFGSVYLCEDIITANKFAVKQIKKGLLTERIQIRQLKNEVKIMRKANSPLCVQLYRVYEDDDNVFFVMEYLPYGNLLQRLMKVKKFEENEAILLIRNLLDTLFYFECIGVIHRDIKLENILMASPCNNYEIKVIDFGLACFVEKCDNLKCGSPGFIAPEVLQGLYYSSKIDVFSAGVVCYTLLTGKLPFYSKNPRTVLEKNEKCEINFDRQDWKNFSNFSANFIRGVLTKDPISRPSVEEALNHPWISQSFIKNDIEYVSSRLTFTDFNKS